MTLEIPTEASGFVDAMMESGFVTLETAVAASFGDELMVLGRGGLRIRLVRDKGLWFVEARAGNDRWYDFDVWRACLDDEDVQAAPTPFVRQLAGFEARWRELDWVADDPERALCLERTGRERTRIRLARRGRGA